MEVKEIDRTANIAWSPAAHHPIYLATGTAAQQLDATFSTTASLEIYDLNLSEPSLDMTLKGSIVSDYRFHKLVWGCMGMKTSEASSGMIVGGTDGGIFIYDPAKLIAGEEALLYQKSKHSGPVHSLDFNKFQECLLASGSCESEIFIWDLNNPTNPMTPGGKCQPTDDVTCVAWNCQVQHILASTFPARCVVWDLRKNEPIIKVSDSASKLHCRMVAWHPEVATQLCLASDDDHSPFIQLWDLRFATTPVQNLEHHQRGVLAVAWCPQDPDLLLSCGKDNRILCWNPNSAVEGGEVVYELPASSQWSFDIAWCPKNPAVIASSSCDDRVSVYSLMGGQQQIQCSSKIAESFPGSDRIRRPHVSAPAQRQISVSLKKPPKWLRKPVGASFAFGGRLVKFCNQNSANHPNTQNSRCVNISVVVTEPELLMKASELESALCHGQLAEFCQRKSEACTDLQDKLQWNFLEATFSSSPRAKMLSLLGYDYQKVNEEVDDKVKNQNTGKLLSSAGTINQTMAHLSDQDKVISSASKDFDKIADITDKFPKQISIKTDLGDADCLLNRALLTGNIEAAVELCLQDSRWADALVLAQAGGHDLIKKTQNLYFKSVETNSSMLICAVATSNWKSVIQNCAIDCWKEALAAILTYAKPEEFSVLCDQLGNRLEREHISDTLQHASICYISSGNLEQLAELWSKENLNTSSFLQCLVEQIMVLRHAVEKLSGSAPLLKNSTLCSLLSQFAMLIASQGNVKSAATFLVDSKEDSCTILRDRIYQSLGCPSPHFPFQRVEIHKERIEMPAVKQELQHNAPTQERKQSFPYLQVQQVQQSQQIQPSQQLQFRSYSSQQSLPHQLFSTAGDHVPYSTASLPQAISPHSGISQYQAHAPPPTAIPPTSIAQPILTGTGVSLAPVEHSSGLKGSSGHHLSQRYPKHLHDPSVYSEMTYSNQYQQSYSAMPSQMRSYNQPITQQPVSYYGTEQNSVSFAAHSSVPYFGFQSQDVQASDSGPYSSTPVQPFPSAYGEMKTGWNDPPPLKQPTAEQLPTAYEAPPPITVPLVGALVPEIPRPPSAAAPSGYVGAQFASQPHSLPLNFTRDHPVMPSQHEAPELPKEKGPMPPEHQALQDTFEDLRQQCQQVATNPQTRRKLEDVAKKLENLYDQLRERKLSDVITLGLHQIVQAVLQSDYHLALSLHGEIVSTTNFSEISGFMPSVKVLLQTASQLGVFLQ